MNTALAHHWIVSMRGGEKVLQQLGALFPRAPIYTLIADRAGLSPALLEHRIRESALRRVPGGLRHYKKLLPLFPMLVRGLRPAGRPDFLLSSDACVIKGIGVATEVPHVCYCHSPPRYLWGMQETYFRHTAGLGAAGRGLFNAMAPAVRRFDYAAAQKVDCFLANSTFVQKRIQECYGRESTVIYPPVAVQDFCWEREPENFYLVVSELVSYKRVDLAVEAFNRLGRPLAIIGGGAALDDLRQKAKANIRFLGRQPFPVLKLHFERCRALIFPGVEDFGITPLEAHASGRPVIAFGEGGALETVVEGKTGVFFQEQTAEALAEAVERFEGSEARFRPEVCRQRAEQFSEARFRSEVARFLRARFPAMFGADDWPNERGVWDSAAPELDLGTPEDLARTA